MSVSVERLDEVLRFGRTARLARYSPSPTTEYAARASMRHELCEEYQHLDRGPVIKSIQAAVTQFSITRANLGSAELDHIARKRVADAALRRRRRKSPQVAKSMSITAGGLR